MKKSNTSKRLKEIMRTRGMRQVDILNTIKPIAEATGVRFEKNDLSQYVSGKVEPSQQKLTVLSKALGVSETWLMGYDDHDAIITIEEPTPLIYADDDFELYSSSRRLQDNAEPFIRNSLLTLTEPIPNEDPTPTRAEILNWLAEHVRTAAYGGSNYEDFSDEDLLAFYLDIRQEAENN